MKVYYADRYSPGTLAIYLDKTNSYTMLSRVIETKDGDRVWLLDGLLGKQLSSDVKSLQIVSPP